MRTATRFTMTVFLGALVAAAAGCGDNTSLNGPDHVRPITPSLDAAGVIPGQQDVSAAAITGMASGHASLHGTQVQNVKDEQYSFSARLADASPLATGQITEHHVSFDGHEVMMQAEVTCAAIVGNQAWIGTRLTRLVLDGEDQPVEGFFPIFRVIDLGEGHGASDRASLVFFAAEGRRFENDRSYCDARPSFPILFESTLGNIQVKPQ